MIELTEAIRTACLSSGELPFCFVLFFSFVFSAAKRRVSLFSVLGNC